MLTDSPLHTTLSTRIPTAAVGPHRYLTAAHLIRLNQEAAMLNTLQLKLSSPELIERYGLTWILRRQFIRAERWPRLNDHVRIVTCPTGFQRGLLTQRDYHLENEDGEVLIRTGTEWVLMDLESRRLKPIPDSVLAISDDLPDPADCMTLPSGKPSAPAAAPATDAEPAAERHFRVPFHQLDFNNHLTNPVYPEFMVEPLGETFLRTHNPTEIDLAFQHEARYGEYLAARAEKTGDLQYCHSLEREGSVLATMRSRWERLV